MKDVKELYETRGEVALQELSRRKPIVKNRVASEIEAETGRCRLEAGATAYSTTARCSHTFHRYFRGCPGWSDGPPFLAP